MGLKESGLRGSLRNVSVGIDAIPDSAVWQVVAEDFGDSWSDQVGDADLDVDGLSESTMDGADSIFGDGNSDNAVEQSIGDVPIIEQNDTWAALVTIQTTDDGWIFGSSDAGDTEFWFRVLSGGGFQVTVSDDSGDSIRYESETVVADGEPHAIVVNKPSNSELEIWIDDMNDEDEEGVETLDQEFDPNDYTRQFPLTFFARDNGDGPEGHIEADIGCFEFADETYSEAERIDFVDRRPEVN